MTDLQAIVEEIHASLSPRRGEGKVADYIPQLAHVDPQKFGMAVVGEVHPDRMVTNSAARAGDVLVLTKPIGTGVITTALKAGAAPDDVPQADALGA